eukprot:1618102-Amphidinium_carterae.1
MGDFAKGHGRGRLQQSTCGRPRQIGLRGCMQQAGRRPLEDTRTGRGRDLLALSDVSSVM